MIFHQALSSVDTNHPFMDLDADNPLAVEIRQEMAAAYFAACKRMLSALDAFKAFNLATSSSPLTDDETRRRTELLEEAAERVYFVLIQREAIKLPGSVAFFDDYDVPHEVRAHLGPRRRR